jgi:Acyl-CoA carboxylase epsilon subunit
VTEPAPLFRVVRGQPTDEETAALAVVLAVLAARACAARDRPGPAGAGSWASHARALRARAAPGPRAWRRSALPR